ncbi:trichothecene efflux pump [Apiospora rasikravindrae]|uniref:Trichothecene efflux pump n=1 Tax=Apiospora rasikravindrae TaxID=990691 RepID=A0ABR1S304_9PEZI
MDSPKDATSERAERVVEKTHIDGTVDFVSADVLGGDVENLPAGYFRSPQFIGTVVATCTASICAYLSWVMPANTLSLIDADLGPSNDIGWVGTAYLLGNGIGFLLVGRLSDIFGRRWMVLACNSLSIVGCVLGAAAPSVGALIAATLLNGFAAAGQLSHQVILGELVPNRLRGPIVTLVFLSSLPFAVFGPAIARLFILNTSSGQKGSRVGGWRWSFYLGIIFSVVTVALYAVFYHPPRYEQLHVRGRTKWQQVRALDFGGLFLFCAGMTLFLVGLSWGGTTYPWRSAPVLATLIIGIVVLVAFGFYEQYVAGARDGGGHGRGGGGGSSSAIMPPRIFRNVEYVAIVMIAALSAMVYFSMTVLWPTLITHVFGASVMDVGWQSSVVGGGVLLGQTIGGLTISCGFGVRRGVYREPGGRRRARGHTGVIVLGIFATVAVGIVDNIAFPGVTLLFDACDIGLAAGALASIRSMGGAVAQALYVSVLNTRLAGHLAADVGPAAIRAGLPETSLSALFAAIKVDDFSEVPGATREVVDVVEAVVRDSYVASFKVVFYATIPFGVLLVAFACLVPDMDKYLTGNVARRLQNKDAERGTPSNSD